MTTDWQQGRTRKVPPCPLHQLLWTIPNIMLALPLTWHWYSCATFWLLKYLLKLAECHGNKWCCLCEHYFSHVWHLFLVHCDIGVHVPGCMSCKVGVSVQGRRWLLNTHMVIRKNQISSCFCTIQVECNTFSNNRSVFFSIKEFLSCFLFPLLSLQLQSFELGDFVNLHQTLQTSCKNTWPASTARSARSDSHPSESRTQVMLSSNKKVLHFLSAAHKLLCFNCVLNFPDVITQSAGKLVPSTLQTTSVHAEEDQWYLCERMAGISKKSKSNVRNHTHFLMWNVSWYWHLYQ